MFNRVCPLRSPREREREIARKRTEREKDGQNERETWKRLQIRAKYRGRMRCVENTGVECVCGSHPSRYDRRWPHATWSLHGKHAIAGQRVVDTAQLKPPFRDGWYYLGVLRRVRRCPAGSWLIRFDRDRAPARQPRRVAFSPATLRKPECCQNVARNK